MIQANELRVGNWVKDRGCKMLQVDRFYASKIECDIKGMPNNQNGISVYYHPLTEEFEYLQPIPLTPEILEKCGFVSNPYQDRYELGDIHIEYCAIRNMLWIENAPHIQHLHQLQNYVYINTNEELTFKP